jgi:hypothetical protein
MHTVEPLKMSSYAAKLLPSVARLREHYERIEKERRKVIMIPVSDLIMSSRKTRKDLERDEKKEKKKKDNEDKQLVVTAKKILKKTLKEQKDEMKEICKAIKMDGNRCTCKVKINGLCGKHVK